MQILRTPGPFSPAFGEVLYAVAVDESERGAEIGVFNSAVTEKIGIKKVDAAPEFTLNVADYLRTQVNIEPLPVQPCGIVETPGRTFTSCVAHGEWSARQVHTAGIVAVAPNEPMVERDVRRLAEDEQDEIGWVAAPGSVFARALFGESGQEPLEIHLGRAEIDTPRTLALVLNGADLARRLAGGERKWSECTRFTVEIHFDYRTVVSFDYRLAAHNPRKTRLAWWNRRGGVDFHSFESGVEHRTFKDGEGKIEKILRTAHTTRPHALRLAEIAGAPKVWIVEGETARPVHVGGETAFTIDDPEQTALEIRVTEVEKIPFQIL